MSGWTEIISALSAPIAIAATVYAIHVGARKQIELSREQRAYAVYYDYSKMCIEHPGLTSWEVANRSMSLPCPSKIWDSVTVESNRYLWFVSYGLMAFSEMMSLSAVKDWKAELQWFVRSHKPVFEAVWEKEWKDEYSPQIGRLVAEELRNTNDA